LGTVTNVTDRCALVIGAAGYVGARLVPRLLRQGDKVRVLVREPAKLRDTPWRDRVEVVTGDVLVDADVRAAAPGVDVVHYLVHALSRSDFAEVDRAGAESVARAAADSGVRRIVYLGGLQPTDDRPVSRHLASRAEVGEVFLSSSVPTTVLRAGVIIGSGSTSFEILRYLIERLPVVPAPGWMRNRVQPIAIDDVLHYLLAAAELSDGESATVDIGGPEALSYWELLRRYARVAGLGTPVRLPAPPVPSALIGQVLGGLTPVQAAVATPLIESLAHEMVCGPAGAGLLPDPPGGLRTVEQAIRDAIGPGPDRVDGRRGGAGEEPDSGGPAERSAARAVDTDMPGSGGPLFVERITRDVPVAAERLWRVVEGIGGEHGYHGVPLVWQVRGLADRLLGGVGAYRGRRDPDHLVEGEVLDWWRVEAVEPDRRLLLRAEMKMPGTAWLELAVEPLPDGSSRLHQNVIFEPAGPLGHVYWWAERAAHLVVFQLMASGIARAAERAGRAEPVVAGAGR
jgi:uncharacterized protein YbjT (DUF2867 family)